MKGNWQGSGTFQTTGGGGGDLAGLVVLALLLLVGGGIVAGIAQAVAEIAVYLFAVVGFLVLSAVALVAWCIVHRHRHPAAESRYERVMQPRLFQMSEPEPQAVKATAPAAIEQHVHFHVNDVADVAEILRRQQAPE